MEADLPEIDGLMCGITLKEEAYIPGCVGIYCLQIVLCGESDLGILCAEQFNDFLPHNALKLTAVQLAKTLCIMEPPKHVAQRTRWEKDDDGLVLHIQRFIQDRARRSLVEYLNAEADVIFFITGDPTAF